jgi:Mrp family chromosome partitioning ATPase
VADSGLLAAHADGTLLVVRQAETPKPLLSEALKTENLKLLGVVANQWESLEHRYYSQYYRGYTARRELIPIDSRLPQDSRQLPNPIEAER